jgi:hypothetical protein
MEPLAPCVLWGSPPTLPDIHLVEVLPECGVLATASDASSRPPQTHPANARICR